MGHHGEVFQGVVRDQQGRLHRALCSLPCGGLSSEAVFHVGTGKGIVVYPAWKTKARRAAQLALEWAGRSETGGYLEVSSDIPPGWGLGSSTSDVTAALRAVFAALQMDVGNEVVARLAVKAETACDSTIFNQSAVLFAHREGEVLEDLGGPIPECEVLGFNSDDSGNGVDTLEFSPARYGPKEIETFAELLGVLRRAIRAQDVRLLGQVATACARINQAYLPTPRFEQLEEVVSRVGAVGIQVAHSGTVVGLLFDPRGPEKDTRIQTAREELVRLGFSRQWSFSTTKVEPLHFED
ncbi:GHMP kinase [Cystobacter fuscus]|uniref:GHMP kinase n=1 Tax=Cystobacter fuscus TaxID=43 RepID=A0A250J4R7_9BACT|nr:kinase [Cystobacter fuscus]ATB38929.1 GHMP kinase [Cystobacter fuscus]